MAQQAPGSRPSASPHPKRAPSPASWKPGQSGNPKGRPRKGDALSEAIREHVNPTELIEVARGIMEDEDANQSVRLQAAQFLAERGYRRPVEQHEHGPIGASDDDGDADLEGLTPDELREIVEIGERQDAIMRARAERRELAEPEEPAAPAAPRKFLTHGKP